MLSLLDVSMKRGKLQVGGTLIKPYQIFVMLGSRYLPPYVLSTYVSLRQTQSKNLILCEFTNFIFSLFRGIVSQQCGHRCSHFYFEEIKLPLQGGHLKT